MSNALAAAMSGGIFGSALLLSGVYSPTIITSQLILSDFHMLKVFLTASASSALLIRLAKRTNISSCTPRGVSNLHRLHLYDGNVIGGLLLGAGMALTGACPGTVLIQISTGVSSGLPVLTGAVIGGILWTRFGNYAKCPPPATSATSPQADPVAKERLTLYASGTKNENKAVLIYELACLAIVVAASYFMPSPPNYPRTNPVVGGLLIGGAQAASLFLTGSLIGVSTAYERTGQYLCRTLGIESAKDGPLPSLIPVVFALGMVGGSWSLSRAIGLQVPEEMVHISSIRAMIGGAVMILGARMAGGCTSGHGISGMATLSKSSFVTVGAMFGGGIGLSMILQHLM